MSQPSSTPVIAGDLATLARRYAAAFYELAEEQSQLDTVAQNIRALKHLLQESSEFQYIAAHPRLTRHQQTKAMKEIAAAAQFNDLTGQFMGLLAHNRRLRYMDAILNSFLSIWALRRGEYTADVRTAKPLSAAQQEQLSIKLNDLIGGKIHLSIQEDKSLLGGFVVTCGSRLIDASIKNKLAQLERQLTLRDDTMEKGAA